MDSFKEIIIPILIAIASYLVLNLIVFAMYGIDKRKAQRDKWRISESTLILSAFCMGGLGALIGMKKFRHKTKNMKFKILVPLALISNIAIVAVVVWGLIVWS